MSFGAYQLPPPADWQAFERFTRDLFAAHWNCPTAEMNGRAGQAQAGVDVYGINFSTGKLEAVQCKGKDGRFGHSVTKDELRGEVDKALTFKPQPSHYYLVTSGAADVAVQEEARLISSAHASQGKFPVQVFGWEQLLALLHKYPKVARAHFRPLLVALSQIDAPAELIAICHQSFQHAGMFDDVDPAAAADGFHPVHMDASAFYEGGVLDVRGALALQRNLYRDVTAQLRAHPKATVAYFGIAHIPLSMHAGTAVSTKHPVRLYELDATAAESAWNPLLDGNAPDLGVELVDMGGPVGGPDAVIQVDVSARVAKTDIDQSIDCPYRHFVVRIAEPKRGVITHYDQVSAIANAFREALDKIHNENPATTHHVFAATPMSVSFRLGQMVSQTMHRSVRAYNYSQRSAPPYFWAVDLVAADGQPGQLWISGE
ncbi:SAVED domain-containing protein [Burkholderia arboris]|uniref:SAVED domain-containing protein n=1 Tax=Burkholderia arboris TaxID=488730 RepID=UPI001CF2D14B|nr:SAVED domain-containing protein [Burkholderia arboris]MCA8494011.1 SAVED domain-containing protein [Burkholderia arboris]